MGLSCGENRSDLLQEKSFSDKLSILDPQGLLIEKVHLDNLDLYEVMFATSV